MADDFSALPELLGGLIKGGETITSAIQTADAQNLQNQYEQMVFSFNSKMATSKANMAIEAGAQAEAIIARQSSQQVGHAVSSAVGGGLMANSGTNAEAIRQTGEVGAHNELMVQFNAEREALTLKTQATQENIQGELALSESQNKQRSTIWSGGSKALSEVSAGFTNLFPTPKVQSSDNSTGIINWDTIPQPETPFGTNMTGTPISAQFGQTMAKQTQASEFSLGKV